MRNARRLWWGLFILLLISPLGLILPEVFQGGPAWGEWRGEDLEKLLGFIPAGFKKISEWWAAPLPDYNLKNWEGQGPAKSGLAYILSGALGVGLIVALSFVLGKLLVRKNRS